MLHILAKGNGKPICDFCSAPEAPWVYEADDCKLWEQGGFGGTSIGDWAACDTCKALIDKGDRNALHRQMYESMLFKEPILSLLNDTELNGIKKSLRHVLETFFAHRHSSSNAAVAQTEDFVYTR